MKFNLKLTSIAVIMLASTSAFAGSVSLLASDPIGTSSFNAAGKWSNSQAPSAANDYLIDGFFLRTPGDSGGVTYTFGGNSLTLTHGNVRNIIVKSGNNDTFIINNLTNAFGGILENGGSGNVAETFTGNQWTIAANSAVMANQGSLVIGYPLIGGDGVVFTNGGGNASGITYNGDNSGFKGILYVSMVNFGNGGGASTVILNAANSAPGNPSAATPNQIMLDAGCTLRDNAGINFNNANGGFRLLGNASINAQGITVIGEPVTDNGGGFSLTASGPGTLVLSNANNAYSGGTVIASGVLQAGVANALPTGNVTVTGSLDLNTHDTKVNGLSGAGSIDTVAGGTPVLTLGALGGSATFSGAIQNSAGRLSLTKVGAGTETLTGTLYYGGNTLVAGGTLVLSTLNAPSLSGDLISSNGATLKVDATSGTGLSANNLTIATNSMLTILPVGYNYAITGNGSLTLQTGATVSLNYGTLASNPTMPAINLSGGVSTPGGPVTIIVSATGIQPGTIPLIKYTGTPLASLANFNLVSPGIAAVLVNNTANNSIDLQISGASQNLSWSGASGSLWDLAAANWNNLTLGGSTPYQQYTNGAVITGDAVTFDDTLSDYSATNITVAGMFSPVTFTANNSAESYNFAGTGGITGSTSLVKSNTASITLLTSNSFTGGVYIYGGSVTVTNDNALGASGVGISLNGGTLGFAGNTTSTRPITTTAASSIDVASNLTVQLAAPLTGAGAFTKTDGGTLVLSADNSLSSAFVVNGGNVNVTGGNLAFAGTSYVGYLNNSGALAVSGGSRLSSSGELRVGGSDTSGAAYGAYGTVNMTGGTANLSALTIARGNNYQNTVSGEVNLSGGTMTSTNDVLIGFAGAGKGILRISGSGTLNVGATATKWLRFGQWDSTSGEIDISGGNLNLNQGTSIKFNQNNSSGPKTFNQTGGNVTFYSDFATTVGGGGNLDLMLTGTALATNTYNLDGGMLTVPQITSSGSTGARIFNFNGGTLKATAKNTAFMNLGGGSAVANVRNGGAIIDDGGFAITIAQALVHSAIAGDNATDGGLTKNGSGTLTLSAANTYNGKTTVNAGVLVTTTASGLAGGATIGDNATLSIAQAGSATISMADLTLNGGASTPGATLGLGITAANNAAVPLVTCSRLTLNGNNTISLAGSVKVGTIALIKATGAIAGAGSFANLILPQGAEGTIQVSFDGTYTTVNAQITSTGPGLVWSGTDSVAPNLWNINSATNWLLNATPTTYQQTIIPGDGVTFNDRGSGTVLLNTTVGPASFVISNNSTAYTFSGSGNLSGPASLIKTGNGNAILTWTNNSYSGDTVVNGGKLTVANASSIPATANLILGGGTLELTGATALTAKQLMGSGILDNNSGQNPILTIGDSTDATWNGTIQDHGAGGVALIKVGSGTWTVGGTNHFNDGQPFTDRNQILGGTVVITNGGVIHISDLELRIANGSGTTGAVVVAGGTLRITNNVLSVGYATNAVGTLTVNSGTIDHSGAGSASFASVANSIDVGAQSSTGTLTMNGGQVLNNSPLYLGDGNGASGTLYLNGGVLQASVVEPNGTPLNSLAYFNGGTLRAATNTADFIVTGTTPYLQSGGMILDDAGWAVSLSSQGLQEDPYSTGGGLIKTGAGTVYLDSFNSFPGTTLVTNGTLAGIGSLTGPVVVAPGANLGAGDAGNAVSSPLSIYNSLTLQGSATFRVSNNGGFAQNDQVSGLTKINYGGVLIINNVTSDGTALTNGVFPLFSVNPGASISGNFTSIVGSPGSGLAYRFNPTNGVLSVVTGSVGPAGPEHLTNSYSAGVLSLSWPAGEGWRLQMQTNNLATGLSTNWIDVTDGSINSTNITTDPTRAAVYYRLAYP